MRGAIILRKLMKTPGHKDNSNILLKRFKKKVVIAPAAERVIEK